MSRLQQSVGLKGKLTIERVSDGEEILVGGITNWAKEPDARNIIDIPTVFGVERDEKAIGTKVAINCTWTGVFILQEDAGQVELRDAYNSERHFVYNQIRFYIHDDDTLGHTGYWTPANDSYAIITSVDDVAQDAGGTATYGGSCLIVGDLTYSYNTS